MSKNTIMVLAVIVALLSGWLVLELASKSSMMGSGAGATSSGGQTTTNSESSVDSTQSKRITTHVEIMKPTTTSVEVQ